MKRRNRAWVYLVKLLTPFDDWENKGGAQKNQEAKEALIRVYGELLKMKPDRQYKQSRVHTNYLRHLPFFNRALMEEKYMIACNELITLLHDEPFLQGRVYYNILKAFRDSLGDELTDV